MIGRDHELAAIERWLHEDARRGGVLVVEGEAGIGKTTLWNAGVDLGTQEGFRVLATRPSRPKPERGPRSPA
jgi:KaiC/GvpD/RAD55 family RecA-like ATPase